jgi:hypothetical protein
MEMTDPRAALDALIRDSGDDMASISKMIGRNAAYIQQFIRRGTPKRLAEDDRRTLARYFGVAEERLGGRAIDPSPAMAEKGRMPRRGLVSVPRLEIGASAGPGAFAGDERPRQQVAFEAEWLRALVGSGLSDLSIIQVAGDSMSPTLSDGDEILVDRADAAPRLRDGIYVLRMDDALLVKRLALNPVGPRLSVLSDNPAYPSWPDCAPGTVEVIGRVVWAARRIS